MKPARKILLSSLSIIFIAISGNSCSKELIPPFTEYTKEIGVDYLEFVAYGDAGKGTPEQQLTADAMSNYVSDISTDISFIINLGDSFYENGVDSLSDPLWDERFEDVYDPLILNMPFYCVLGNHDYWGNIKAQLDYVSPNSDRWKMPERYYSISKILPDGTVIDFFFLDTERLIYGDATQLLWLNNELDSSTARWKIVSGHRPLFSYGMHGSNSALIVLLQSMLNNRADIYMAGHEHDLQILHPLNDVSYIVNGSAGSSRFTGVGELTMFSASRSGFMAFLISRNHLVCRVIDSENNTIFSVLLKEKL